MTDQTADLRVLSTLGELQAWMLDTNASGNRLEALLYQGFSGKSSQLKATFYEDEGAIVLLPSAALIRLIAIQPFKKLRKFFKDFNLPEDVIDDLMRPYRSHAKADHVVSLRSCAALNERIGESSIDLPILMRLATNDVPVEITLSLLEDRGTIAIPVQLRETVQLHARRLFHEALVTLLV